MGCLHDPANVQQTNVQQYSRVFWIHLLDVCWICKHPISCAVKPISFAANWTGTCEAAGSISALRFIVTTSIVCLALVDICVSEQTNSQNPHYFCGKYTIWPEDHIVVQQQQPTLQAVLIFDWSIRTFQWIKPEFMIFFCKKWENNSR